MPGIYIEDSIYKNLSNEELLEKQYDMQKKISKSYTANFPKDLLLSMDKVSKIIDGEVNFRLENNLLDEDEIDNFFNKKNNL